MQDGLDQLCILLEGLLLGDSEEKVAEIGARFAAALSQPVLLTMLAKSIQSLQILKHFYKLLFLIELYSIGKMPPCSLYLFDINSFYVLLIGKGKLVGTENVQKANPEESRLTIFSLPWLQV